MLDADVERVAHALEDLPEDARKRVIETGSGPIRPS
jgi:hypothetical protein